MRSHPEQGAARYGDQPYESLYGLTINVTRLRGRELGISVFPAPCGLAKVRALRLSA
jgi:hypothetical protein